MQNYNSSISQDLNRIFDLKGESTDLVSDIIMPVVPIVRNIDIVRNASSTASGSAIIYTTPSDKDFYLTSVYLSIAADALAEWTSSTINTTILGVARVLVYIVRPTLIPTWTHIYVPFNIPLKLDRGVTISSNITFAAGNTTRAYSIQGYTVETTK